MYLSTSIFLYLHVCHDICLYLHVWTKYLPLDTLEGRHWDCLWDCQAVRGAGRVCAAPWHYPFWSLISLELPHGIVKSYMAFLKDDSFKHTRCKRGWASRSEVLWEVFCLLEMVGFDSEDLKRVGAHSPLGQKHTAWIRTGNLPVI